MKNVRCSIGKTGTALPAMVLLTAFLLALVAPPGVSAQQDPLGRLLEDGLEKAPGAFRTPPGPKVAPGRTEDAAKTVPACADGWECVYAGRVVKGSYKKASVQVDVAGIVHDAVDAADEVGRDHRCGDSVGLVLVHEDRVVGASVLIGGSEIEGVCDDLEP